MDAQNWIDTKITRGKRVLPPAGPVWIGDPKDSGFPRAGAEIASDQ